MKQLPDYFEQFLCSRGLSESPVCIEDPDEEIPCPLHTDDACRLLSDCVKRSVPAAILSDFDCDGLMSGFLSYCGLRMMGFSRVYLCARNTVSGYNPDVSELNQLPSDVGLLFTSDVGSMSRQLVTEAKKRGMRVIVTDHHPCALSDSVEGIADVFVNPMLDGERGNPYAGPRICGAQVVFLLIQRYFFMYPASCQYLVDSDLAILSHFAGIAAVSDRMPLEGFNGPWVKQMLCFFRYMNPGMASAAASGLANHPVLQNACINFHQFVCCLQGEIGSSFDLEFLEYTLVPVVNSIKRMGGDVSLFYEMLFGSISLCEDHIEKLRELNRQRKDLVEEEFSRLQRDIEEGSNPFSHIFLLPPHVPSGICGLVAQKLVESHGIPCVVIQQLDDGSYAGSARTAGTYLFKTELSSSGFARCGGHEEAFGVSFVSYPDVLFGDQFIANSFAVYLQQQGTLSTSYDVLMDYVSDFDQDFHRRVSRFVSDLSEVGPFGPGNPPPFILFRFPFSRGLFTEFGPEYAPHLRIYLGYGFQCVLWRTDVLQVADCVKDGMLYLAGTLNRVRTLSGSHIRFTCHPVLDGSLIYETLASERMVDCEQDVYGDASDFEEEML